MARHICLARLLLVLFVFLSLPVSANGLNGLLGAPVQQNNNHLFTVTGYQAQGQLHVDVRIAPGAKLYRDRVSFTGDKVQLGTLTLPDGVAYEDPEFGVVPVFHDTLAFSVPVIRGIKGDTVTLELQGCTEGICYPPQSHTFTLTQSIMPSSPPVPVEKASSPSAPPVASQAVSDIDSPGLLTDFSAAVGDELWQAVMIAVLLGAGLALTPCVFPMYPILSTVVVGSGQRTKMRALLLSLSYVQGMAIVYSLLGLVVATMGLQVQVALQQPWVLSLIGGIFVLLAMSMFGVFTLRLPDRYQTPLNKLNTATKGGSVVGAFVIGALSALVASPCTTAPLAGVLVYVAQSGDVIEGFAVLYALSMGMGLPLILFGVAGGTLLPRAGAWMNNVKHAFGFLSLAMAIYFVSRFAPPVVITVAGVALALALLTYIQYQREGMKSRLGRSLTAMVVVSGVVGVGLYGYHTVTPSQGARDDTAALHLPFSPVTSQAALSEALSDAAGSDKVVMLDLYASWCSACITYEKEVFTDAGVHLALEDTVLLQADMTTNSEDNQALQSQFNVVGLPSILFFRDGKEIPGSRITGALSAKQFRHHVEKVLN